jgi:protein-tyrosine phosphatase
MAHRAIDQTGLRLDGAPNFRDIGGYAAADGGYLRSKRVFRSDVLSRLTDADLAKIAGLDIRLVFDLRLPGERRKEQNRWPDGHRVETISFDERADLVDAQVSRWQDLLRTDQLEPEGARELMIGVYRRMPRALAVDLAVLFKRLDGPACPPMLVHCTGGKDRSGFVCAMLLWSLGVPIDAIVADYLVSAQRLAPERFVAERLSASGERPSARQRAALMMFAMTDAAYLAAAFDQVCTDFGAVDAYLETACGLDVERKTRLRSTLVCR